jgi:hypothetical protein
MESVWHVEIVWAVDTPGDDDLDRAADYSALVGGLGGEIGPSGDAQFRRYRAAEVCAYTLRRFFGMIPRIRLGPRS